MTHWYTADTHFGHESVIPFWGRPFRHASHMDSVLIERMWEKVGPDDDLWIVGDFACGPKAHEEDGLRIMYGQLLGARQHLVVGNHDGPLTRALPWDSVSWLAVVKDLTADQPLTLCHYPMMTWNHASKSALHLFGHVHGNWEGTTNSVNVGVDVWDFSPITAQDAAERARRLPVNHHWEDVDSGA